MDSVTEVVDDPPDLRIGSSIGVEVRRLTENYFGNRGAEDLDHFDRDVHTALQDVLRSFDDRYDGDSYWIGIEFGRPRVRKVGTIKDRMTEGLDTFLGSSQSVPTSIEIGEQIRLRLFPSKPVEGRVFRHMVSSDRDSGGDVGQLLIDNIQLAIDQKDLPWSPQYRTRWLILVDHIGTGADVRQSELEDDLLLKGFDRVIVIDHVGKSALYEFA